MKGDLLERTLLLLAPAANIYQEGMAVCESIAFRMVDLTRNPFQWMSFH